MKDWLYEQKHRVVDHFYFWFGTDEYLKEKEPILLYDKWICGSIPWELFHTYKEAEQALKLLERK